MLRIGQSYWFGRNIRHLYFIVSDPDLNPDEVVAVNMTTINHGEKYDSSCVLHPGDHVAVTRPSYISYWRMQISSRFKIEDAIAIRVFSQDRDLRHDVLRMIQAGLIKSKDSKRRAKEILIDQGVTAVELDAAEEEL